MNFFTQTELKRLARRLEWLGRLNGLSRILIGIAILFALLQLVAAQMPTPGLRALVYPVGLGALALLMIAESVLKALETRASRRMPEEFQRKAAQLLEQTFPDLDLRLLTAMENRSYAGPTSAGGSLLARQLEDELSSHCRAHRWSDIVPARRVTLAWSLFAFSAALFAVSAGSGALQMRESLLEWGAGRFRDGGVLAVATPADVDFDLHVDPGDAEIERGTPLLILARFVGSIPEEVAVRFSSGDEQSPSDLQMRRTLADPVFFGRLAELNSPVDYEIVFPGGRSEVYHVTVFEYPRLVRADATITPPEYTAREPTTLVDVRELATVEGSHVRLTLQLNKPVTEAHLASVTDGGPTIKLLPAPADNIPAVTGDETASIVLFGEIDLHETVQLELQLRDAEGRENRERPVFTLQALENEPPKLTVHFPDRDMPVSPLQELVTEASAFDDFGLLRFGVTYHLASSEPTEMVLAENVPGGELGSGQQLISLESLDARPDQLLTYYFFADDIGPDGEPRRTYSDMYFCEVRDFEEIFREGQQPPGGQSGPQGAGGQNGNQIEELTKLQQQIVTATWRMMRDDLDDLQTLPLGADAEGPAARLKIVADSEAEVRKRLEELIPQLQSVQAVTAGRDALVSVQQALDHLNQAARQIAREDGSSRLDLSNSIAAEQAAYQHLLALRAREHTVVQNQAGGGQGGGGSRSQQELQQLELSQQNNRYETRSQAAQASNAAQSEEIEILQKLRELAQRQQDSNQRLQQLMAERRAAKTDAERDEIERQLKRLRDHQREMLRDLEQIASKAAQTPRSPEQQQLRQQMEQSRSHAAESARALDEGRLSDALAEGTRAERKLNDLGEEFRRRTARQFTDEMRQLRQQARDVSQRQSDLQKSLVEQPEAGKSLRPTVDRRKTADRFRSQKQEVESLVKQAEEVVRKSEAAEPLLARRLYEALRQLRSDRPVESLDVGARLMDRGLQDEAAQAAAHATNGVKRLEAGISEAAETVLGSEVEGLRRARVALGGLSEQLRDELPPDQRRTGQAAEHPSAEKPSGSRPSGEAQSPPQPSAGQQPANGEPAGSQPGGKEPGGKEPGGKEPGGKEPGGKEPGGKEPGQSQSSQSPSGGAPSGGTPSSGGQPSNSQGQGEGQGPRQPTGRPSGGQSLGGPSSTGGGGSRGTSRPGMLASFLNSGSGGEQPSGPITGDGFLEWFEGMRSVEEMLDNPELRAEVQRVRERARDLRSDVTRHSQPPDWDLIQSDLIRPLVELEDRIAEEIRRQNPDRLLVPIDRDPVPKRYSDQVREYYKSLGRGE